MKFKRLPISDLVLIEPYLHKDKRGSFKETYRQDLFEKFIGKKVNFVQDNESVSFHGVLRGLHYQLEPYSQCKLVRVSNGSVLDVVVDLRKKSNTYGKHFSIELSSENNYQLFIPEGFAHGFVVLSNQATFCYKVNKVYNKEFSRGIIYNDEYLNINWIIKKENLKISEKDLLNVKFVKSEKFNF